MAAQRQRRNSANPVILVRRNTEKTGLSDAAFDDLLRQRFEKTVRHICRTAGLWAEDADGLLALIILLDQMTRNIFRDTPMAFAGDDMARLTLKGIDRGDLDVLENQAQRQFMLMPMMHAEDLAIQEASLPCLKHTPMRTL